MSILFGSDSGGLGQQQSAYNSIRIQRSNYGVPIPIVYGKNRLSGNIIWLGDLVIIPNTDTNSTGGKGGGSVMSTVHYTYQIPVIILLCEGPITGIRTVWKTKNIAPSAEVIKEHHTIPNGSPYTVSVTPPSGQSWLADAGVFFHDGTPLVKVASSPGVGQYSVNAGVYTFNSADSGGRTYTVATHKVYHNKGYWKLILIRFQKKYVWVKPGFDIISTISTFENPTPVYISYYYGEASLSQFGLSLYPGAYPEAPPGFITSNYHGTPPNYEDRQDLDYSGLAKVFSSTLDLGSSNSPPNFSFETIGFFPSNASDSDDANPADIINDFLTNTKYGVGFPSANLGSLTNFSNYCIATGIFLSPIIDSQTPAAQLLAEWLKDTNTGAVWSGSILNLVPYGDTAITDNGVTYTPNITPVYDLTDDDFIIDSHDQSPIEVTRKDPLDAFNTFTVEFVNRDHSYNSETIEMVDQSQIDLYGRRPASTHTSHAITSYGVAQKIANIQLQRNAYLKNIYKFNCNWSKILLEPMDLVTLTDSTLGFNKLSVRITEVEENEEGLLTFTAEDYFGGVAHAPLFTMQLTAGLKDNYNANPGDIESPVIFEPTGELSEALEIWMGATGRLTVWGGCQVWVSLDNLTYKSVGNITAIGRLGILNISLASGAAIDNSHTLEVDTSKSLSQLLNATVQDAVLDNTLCFVDGELISYATSTLIGTYLYDLTVLYRGRFGSTISAHNAGTDFMRLDNAIFKFPFTQDLIGKTIYLKFLSFNTFGSGLQQLADVNSFQYQIKGTAFTSPLPDIQNLTTVYRDGKIVLVWDKINDFRSPIEYEIRKGATWGNGLVVGAVTDNSFIVLGDDTYWISARFSSLGLPVAYSLNPVSLAISGSSLLTNVKQTYDENGTGWSGTLGTHLSVNGGGNLLLDGTFGVPATYTVPAGHKIDLGYVAPVDVSVIYAATGLPHSGTLFSTFPLISTMGIISGANSKYVSVFIEIWVSQNGTTGTWFPWKPGMYVGRAFEIRVTLSSTDPSLNTDILMTALSWTVDMPDVVDKGVNIAIAGGGTAITFNKNFQIVPSLVITILNIVAGDDIFFTAGPMATGFTVQIKNGGAGVARNINWTAVGY